MVLHKVRGLRVTLSGLRLQRAALTIFSQIAYGALTTGGAARGIVCCMKAILVSLLALSSLAAAADRIPNRLIDYPQFQLIAAQVAPVREQHRITEDQFLAMSSEPGTVVLDARSADKYAMRHIKGAVNLPFTDFTVESLARAIPEKTTRILIYCNNNFNGAPRSLTAKSAPASLNISTYIALATYGYQNVFELGPLLDVRTTKLPFVGTEVGQTK